MESYLLFLYQLRDASLIVIAALAAYLMAIYVIRKVTSTLVAMSASKTARSIDSRVRGIQSLLLRIAEIVLLLWAALLVLDVFRVDIMPFFATAGIAGIVITFASQSLLKDIAGGIGILLHDRFRKGDIITVNGIQGVVEDITLTHTILSEKHTTYSIPNGSIGVVGVLTTDQRRKN